MTVEAKRDALLAELPRLRRYAMALLRDRTAADDLVQDSVLRALDRLHLWREGTNMRTWLFTIMHNLYANKMRSLARRRDDRPLDAAVMTRGEAPNQLHAVALAQLGEALATLPDAQRETLLLVGLEGMSYRESAEVLDVPVGTVMSRVSRARETLRRHLDGEAVPQLRQVK